ncbi:uncharacterized protein LOC128459794 isoform X4 [Pleuronectes platessa]|uniref:uncharacterized protein LOC128459794 isoform X4 n=2 Tax=Pleuronectes platessa TaxID=8262 RepID=UPI00232A4241|nr:uncharacterized protein LOC128459794 isoform X4 [Pleuronectes platessa]
MPNETTARDCQSIPDMTQIYREGETDMPEESRNYQSTSDMPQIIAASWRMFCVILGGITNNTHVEFVKMIKSHGHTEVMDPEGCDYCLLFCPITSRVGTDVELALRKIPANKPTILVVMYHTFDSYRVVPESSSLTEDPRVHLTVSCLFYEQNLLNSARNVKAKNEIRKFLGLSQNLSIISRSLLSIRKSLLSIRRNLLSIRRNSWSIRSSSMSSDAKWALVSLAFSLIFYGAYTQRVKWLGYLGIWPRRNICSYFRVSPGYTILATTNICSSSV